MTHLSRSVMTGTPLNGTKNVDLPRYDRGIGIGLLATAAGQNRPKRARIGRFLRSAYLATGCPDWRCLFAAVFPCSRTARRPSFRPTRPILSKLRPCNLWAIPRPARVAQLFKPGKSTLIR